MSWCRSWDRSSTYSHLSCDHPFPAATTSRGTQHPQEYTQDPPEDGEDSNDNKDKKDFGRHYVTKAKENASSSRGVLGQVIDLIHLRASQFQETRDHPSKRSGPEVHVVRTSAAASFLFL